MRKKILYTGVDPKGVEIDADVTHHPLISMRMRSTTVKEINDVFGSIYKYSHILFTSKYAVQTFFHCMKEMNVPREYLESVYLLAIGPMTAEEIEKEGVYVHYVGSDETEVGIIRLLETLDLEDSKVLLPQSAMTRPKLIHYLVEKSIAYEIIILYDLLKEKPDAKLQLEDFDELIFTSPVAVEAFFDLYGDIIPSLIVHTKGLMTRCKLKACLDKKQLV